MPTLYDLLLPARGRPRTFPLGHRDYDPVKVGYATAVGEPRFTFDASKVDYKAERKLPPLDIPPDLTTPPRDDRYQIPDTNRVATTISAIVRTTHVLRGRFFTATSVNRSICSSICLLSSV